VESFCKVLAEDVVYRKNMKNTYIIKQFNWIKLSWCLRIGEIMFQIEIAILGVIPLFRHTQDSLKKM
jgi:hypothetical protein